MFMINSDHISYSLFPVRFCCSSFLLTKSSLTLDNLWSSAFLPTFFIRHINIVCNQAWRCNKVSVVTFLWNEISCLFLISLIEQFRRIICYVVLEAQLKNLNVQ